jgi:8-hydroxy-5-deazaflavin:NADPH oxidoreductase
MAGRAARLSGGMRIAVIGTGNIGGTLGARFRAAGLDVVYGVRGAAGQGPGGAAAAPIGAALDGADVVLLAVPGPAVPDFMREHGAALGGKVVVDATNRIGGTGHDGRDAITSGAAGVGYVRAFNTLGWENFAEPPTGAAMFYAADPAAREIAEQLIHAVGLEPVYVGGPEATGTVDGLLPLWFALVQQSGGQRKLAFRLVR